jgi:hypothetical protein
MTQPELMVELAKLREQAEKIGLLDTAALIHVAALRSGWEMLELDRKGRDQNGR